MTPAGRLHYNAEGMLVLIERFDWAAKMPDPIQYQLADQPEDDKIADYVDVVYPFENDLRYHAIVLITALMSEILSRHLPARSVALVIENQIASLQLMDLIDLNQVFFDVMNPETSTTQEADNADNRYERRQDDDRSPEGSAEEAGDPQEGGQADTEGSAEEAGDPQAEGDGYGPGSEEAGDPQEGGDQEAGDPEEARRAQGEA